MKLNKKQTKALDYLEDDTTEEVLFGGAAGPGKSVLGCYWQLKSRYKYPGTRGFIGRAVFKTLKDTTLKSFFEVAAMQGLKRGKEFDLTSSQDKENPNCIAFDNGSLIFLRDLFLYPSDPDFEDLGSLEITDAFVDECSQVVRKAKDILKVRIRYKLDEFNLPPKILFATNPTKNWAYDEFYRADKDKTILPYRKFVQALVIDNPNAPKAYVNSLRQMRDGPEKERLFYGNWEYSDDPTVLCDYDAISDMFTNDHVQPGKKTISADLAMQGRDRFVAGSWDGLICTIKVDKKISTGKEIENDLKQLMIKDGVPRSQTIADSDGLGAYLESYLTGIKEFHGGSSAINKIEFVNLKSECAYKLAEFVNKRQIKIICTQEQRERITQEMGALKARSVTDDEKRKGVVKKDDMKEQLNRSPDYLDMLLMNMVFYVQHQRDWISV
jgi:Phage terminase large subunit